MIILLFFMMIASITLFIMKARNPSAHWMGLVLLGWFFSMAGLVFFISKYGGFYYQVNQVLFFHDHIRYLLLRSPISIDWISRMITIGRSLFIFSLIGLALSISSSRSSLKRWKIYALNAFLPTLNILFYDPIIYRWSLGIITREQMYVISWFTRAWLLGSIVVAILLMVRRYRSMTVPWIKNKWKHILLGVFALVLFYLYLGFMGPLQVTDVRTYYFLYSDFSNFNPPLSLPEWYLGIGFTAVSSVISFIAIWKYKDVDKQFGKFDLQLERKLKIANMGARVFTHGIKNQLLMMQLLLNQTNELVQSKAFPDETDKQIKDHLLKTLDIVNQTLGRLDQLYNSFKTTQLKLKPVSVDEIIRHALEKISVIPPNISLHYQPSDLAVMILADKLHLTETIYNIVINSFEAIGSERPGEIWIKYYLEDYWLIINIQDNGPGIPKDQIGYIFDPFYTSKTTTKNWGVGLSYAKQVIKGHFGYIYVDSTLQNGTSFRILLPTFLTETEGKGSDKVS